MSFLPREVYSKCLYGAQLGHPLWTPQLKTQLRESYQLEGLKIGDVGIVSSIDGSFDVLFNITLPRNEQPYPKLVQEDFTPVNLDPEADLATQDDVVSAHGVISSESVELISQEIHSCDQQPSRADYEFSLSIEEGAVLVLPDGAETCDLANEQRFLDEAIRHGIDWYTCATDPKKAGRLINNDSLYLITGFHKARSWSLGAASRNNSSQQKHRPIKFKVGQFHQDVPARAYQWAAVHGFMGRVGPTNPYEIPNYIRDKRLRRGVNQTVFIRGFRITINKLLFLKTVSVKTRQGTFSGFGTHVDNLLRGRISEPSQSSETESSTDNTVDQDSLVDQDQLYMDTCMSVDRMSGVSQTFHPGDSINQYLLKKEPRAIVAVTHDNLWIEMLRRGLLKVADFSHDECLHEVLSKGYQLIVEDGAVYIQNNHAFESPPHEDSSTPIQSHKTLMGDEFPTSDHVIPQEWASTSPHSTSASDLAPERSPRNSPPVSTSAGTAEPPQSHTYSSSLTEAGQPVVPRPYIITTAPSPYPPTSSVSSPPSNPSHTPPSRSCSHSRSLSHSRSHSSPGLSVDPSEDTLAIPSGSFSASGPLASSSLGQQEQTVISVNTNKFVTELYNMINDAESQQYVKWTDPGASFIVSNASEFSRSTLGSHFKHNNFSSFVRQLNMYGFHKINRTPHTQCTSTTQTWEFSHPKFLRDRPDLLEAIKHKVLEPDPRERHRVEFPGEMARLVHELREENRALWREVRSLSNQMSQAGGHGPATTPPSFGWQSDLRLSSLSSTLVGDDDDERDIDWGDGVSMNAPVKTSIGMSGRRGLEGDGRIVKRARTEGDKVEDSSMSNDASRVVFPDFFPLLQTPPTSQLPIASSSTSRHPLAPSDVPAPPDPDAISCICGFTHEDGFSIACDDCSRWCHAACFGITQGGGVPESWKCWVCDPALQVDIERAVQSQRMKFESRHMNAAHGTSGKDASNKMGPKFQEEEWYIGQGLLQENFL